MTGAKSFQRAAILENLRGSLTVQIAELANKLQREGHDIVHFEVGQPNFSIPESSVVAQERALREGKTTYISGRGIYKLREAISSFYLRRKGYDLSAESEIFVTNGSKIGIYCIIRSIINAGDEVIIPNPSWVSYTEIVRSCEAVPVFVPLTSGEWDLDMDAIRSSTSSRTKMIVINSPGNPTGRVISGEKFRELREWAIENGVFVISDEMYSEYVYDDTVFTSILDFPDFREWGVCINGFSKTFAMTGLRLGYIIGDKELLDMVDLLTQVIVTCGNSIAQWGGIEALSNYDTWFPPVLEGVNKIREHIIERLSLETSLEFAEPNGAFYIFVRYPGEELSMDIGMRLLESPYFTAVTPGIGYGPEGEYHFRISYCRSLEEVDKGIDRLAKFFPK